MSGKGGVYADEDHKDKKERKVMCLLEKLEVLGKLDKLDRRMRIAAVRGCYFISDFMIIVSIKIKTIRGSMQIFPM
jgi:uncharacterized secreted protein with C-terminal beta-propeller domain